jgi:hypothetical protein
MGIFDRQIILYEGKDRSLYRKYMDILKKSQVKFKAFATDDQISCGCCGLNGACSRKNPGFTYSIFVREKDAGHARELIISNAM